MFELKDVINLRDVVDLIPSVRTGKHGKRLHYATLWRWVRRGVKTPDGGTVRLEARKCGSRWVTSHAAVERFLAAQTPMLDSEAVSVPRTPSRRQRDADDVERRLDRIGI